MISQIANLMSIPIGTVCLIISLRAFYVYRLSRSDMLFVLGLAMASISLGTFVGTVGDAHIGGNMFATDWARSFGACGGGLFIFLSSLVKSHDQMRQLGPRRFIDRVAKNTHCWLHPEVRRRLVGWSIRHPAHDDHRGDY